MKRVVPGRGVAATTAASSNSLKNDNNSPIELLQRSGNPQEHQLYNNNSGNNMTPMSQFGVIMEWQSIALVVDRILFWIYVFAMLAIYIGVLVVVPMAKPDEK